MLHGPRTSGKCMNEPKTHEVGQPAPQFNCADSDGKIHDLSAYSSAGQKVILYFYPRDSTPGCTTQACDFRDNMTSKEFTATQFALMTALMSLPRTFLSGTSGYLVEMLNWDLYFIFCSLIAIPALIILKKIKFIIKDE